MILVNFKSYKEGVDEAGVKLAEICRRVGAIPVVSAFDVRAIEGEKWVQHVDGIEMGAHTGWALAEGAKGAGATGTLLNHSEHKLLNDELRKSVQACRRVGLKICICAQDLEEAQLIADLVPDFIAYEPPELIGNREKSVSSEHPDVISKVVKAVTVPVLIGAGIHSGEDVRVGLKLGAKGILVSSDVVLAQDAEKELKELMAAFSESGALE